MIGVTNKHEIGFLRKNEQQLQWKDGKIDVRKKPRRCHINHQYQSSHDKGESDWWSCVSKLSKLFRGIYKWHLQQSSLNASNGWRWDLTHGMTERRLTQETVKESVLPTLTWGYGYVKLLKADHSDTSKFGTQNGELHFVSKCIWNKK